MSNVLLSAHWNPFQQRLLRALGLSFIESTGGVTILLWLF